MKQLQQRTRIMIHSDKHILNTLLMIQNLGKLFVLMLEQNKMTLLRRPVLAYENIKGESQPAQWHSLISNLLFHF